MTLKKLLFAAVLFLAASASFAHAQTSPAPQAAPSQAAPTPQVEAPSAVPAPPGMSASTGAIGGTADLSLIGLFLQAHLVVKFVMLGLVLASIWVWAIIIDKTILFQRMKRQMDRFESTFWSGQSLEELYRSLSTRPNHAMAAIFVAAMREWKRSYEGGARSLAGLTQRLDKVMDVTIAREVERLESRLLVLATVGSAGPFIGLFGTVWGIMTSFQSIAASKNTSLAVVAPGIAEALFATAIGLIAAIPATIFYNKFVSQVNRQAARLEGFADEFSAILSRQIDERG
ncbi:MAG: protein TolQ [Xanthobacteraceae bacterium]|jgi:biopolymer transport protein TolQ|nr:protein TolQ [Xanthobacteraceae bacterium]